MSEKIARLDKSVIDMVYPVGAIYMSVNSTNPGNLFGGKWEQIKDRFMLACGDTYAAGSTGGEAQHTLTQAEMPAHSHSGGGGSATEPKGTLMGPWKMVNLSSSGANGGRYFEVGTTNCGESQPHNNMPPYLTVYMWKRTA